MPASKIHEFLSLFAVNGVAEFDTANTLLSNRLKTPCNMINHGNFILNKLFCSTLRKMTGLNVINFPFINLICHFIFQRIAKQCSTVVREKSCDIM